MNVDISETEIRLLLQERMRAFLRHTELGVQMVKSDFKTFFERMLELVEHLPDGKAI